MDTINSPLDDYQNIYKAAFRKNAEAAFDDIIATSKVDLAQNAATCKEIERLKTIGSDLSSSISRYGCLQTAAIITIIAAIIVTIFLALYAGSGSAANSAIGIAVAIIVIIALIFYNGASLVPKLKSLKKEKREISTKIADEEQKAWEQALPLNTLYSWDIPIKLIEKTVPLLHFDPYVNTGRLSQLSLEYGFEHDLGPDISVKFAHTGEINGSPFAIINVRKHRMGQKQYTGSKTIRWTESIYDLHGKRRRIVRTQTLTATIERPCPVYDEQTYLVFGNNGAPNLRFVRKPNGLANGDGGTLHRWRLNGIKKELKKFSQNLTDQSQYTLMSNHDFEAFFDTRNRSDEVEYRLMFTPIAQQEMTKILRNNTDAYGDNFIFKKSRKINKIIPEHLQSISLDTNPAQYMDYNIEAMRKSFVDTNVNYFRAIYFALAPILCIPLYQQTRSRSNIYGGELLHQSSAWEWEAAAYSIGEDKFADKKSATLNILKASELHSDNNVHHIMIEAFGFSATNRVHRERVFGNDGRYHTVSVDWVEYKPVYNATFAQITDCPSLDKEIIRNSDTRAYSTNKLRRRLLVE